MDNLGTTVRRYREYRGLTQSQLAEHLCIGTRTVMEIENHRGNPQFDILYSLIRELNIPVNQIFFSERSNITQLQEEIIQELSLCTEKQMTLIISLIRTMLRVMNDLD